MSSFEVSPTDITTAPYRHIGLVLAYLPNGRVHQGTFAIVGRNDFLTATHIVIDDETHPVQRMDFFLGVDLNRQAGNFFGSTGSRFTGTLEYEPYPVITWTPATGTLLAYPGQFNQDGAVTTLLDSEAPHDLALVGVNEAIGDQTGWLNLNPLISTAENALSVGYPQNGTGMMARTVSATRSNTYDIFKSPGGELHPGDSGGPLLLGSNVFGVASGGTEQDAVWAALNGHFAELATEMARNDSLLGGESMDTLSFDLTGAANDSAQWLQGYDTPELISGGGGNDTLLGAGGNDVIHGDDGDDLLYADAGDDVLIGGSGNDTLDGGDGLDTLQVSSAAAGIFVDLAAKTPVACALSKNKANIGVDKLSRIENAIASDHADRLQGDANPNHFAGGRGNDTLIGGKGNDMLQGDPGRDSISGGAGADIFSFAAGDSPVSVAQADVIIDFKFAEGDRIRLEGMPNVRCAVAPSAQKTFASAIGSAIKDFGNNFAVSLQFVGKNAVFFADIDSNQVADIAVILVGLKSSKALTSHVESGLMFA